MSTTSAKGCWPIVGIKQLKHHLFAAAGDADYNDVVDAARIAGHKVHLYHSHSVAQTLQGNVDHHEAWHAFLARKSGESAENLEDTGFLPRGTSPIGSKSSGICLAVKLTSHQWGHLHATSHFPIFFLFLACMWYCTRVFLP